MTEVILVEISNGPRLIEVIEPAKPEVVEIVQKGDRGAQGIQGIQGPPGVLLLPDLVELFEDGLI